MVEKRLEKIAWEAFPREGRSVGVALGNRHGGREGGERSVVQWSEVWLVG